jgi:hypothetical protein
MFSTSPVAGEQRSLPKRGELHETARGLVNATLIGALASIVAIGVWVLT